MCGKCRRRLAELGSKLVRGHFNPQFQEVFLHQPMVDFSRFLKFFKLLLCFVQCYILCICMLPYSVFFFKGHRKSLSEPGVSCSTSMSLVCIAESLVFEQVSK